MSWSHCSRMIPVLGVLLMSSSLAFADGDAPKAGKPLPAFGTLTAPSLEITKTQALTWLKESGKSDESSLKSFETVWASDRPLLDRVADTLALGSTDAATLLAEARNPATPAPTAVPAVLKSSKQPSFYRSNLTLAYAKSLAQRKVYEEALEALKTVKAEEVVDPSAYLFHRAVAEHGLMLKSEANQTIARLIEDVIDAPERYKFVGVLMHLDMNSWRDKDLGWIARMMDNIGRRLDLERGGAKTQKMQKEVVARLDEIIKDLENKKSGNCNCNGGSCPNGGDNPNNNIRSSSPQNDSKGGNGTGPGNVDPRKLKELAEVWGTLPPKERAKAMQELQRDVPPRYREVIENYFKKLAQNGSEQLPK